MSLIILFSVSIKSSQSSLNSVRLGFLLEARKRLSYSSDKCQEPGTYTRAGTCRRYSRLINLLMSSMNLLLVR